MDVEYFFMKLLTTKKVFNKYKYAGGVSEVCTSFTLFTIDIAKNTWLARDFNVTAVAEMEGFILLW